MGIYYEERTNSFILQAKASTYVIKIVNNKYISHVYFGNKITDPNVDLMYQFCMRPSFCASPDGTGFSNDTLPLEYPSYGNADLRIPAFQVQTPAGDRITDLAYDSYSIFKGKPDLTGLPHVYAESPSEATTLKISCIDPHLKLRVVLSYTVMEGFDAIIRSAELFNEGDLELRLLRAFSFSMDFLDHGFDMIHLSGAWARERHIIKRKVTHGCLSIESRRGASGHSENPFFALARPNATENAGEVYGFSLIYSGNFYAGVDVDSYDTARISMGISPFDFGWKLSPHTSFVTPEAVLVYSSDGLHGMSETFHRLYRTRLARGKYRDAARPVLINNWEATYFDFTEEKLLHIAKEAANLGMEMFVLDDGWFGNRNDDTSSLGDWHVNEEKIPHGLALLAEKINDLGMGFGLWFEPEMISEKSDLYKAHPDWCIHVTGRNKSLARNQYILDYSRKDVREAIILMLSNILKSAKISYVKWDMNRNMTEIGSALLPADQQMETMHRYILGVYEVMDVITSKFPDVLFESCSGGGGRFDPGILYYMPQNWTSDNTDGVERLKIQYGTSLVYPASAMTCHVSAIPNHQTGRITSLAFRGDVAMAGNFGYELDVTKLSEEEKDQVKAQIATYKEIRNTIQYGEFYRLLSPFEGNFTSFLFVNETKTDAVLFFYQVLTVPNSPFSTLRLTGLDPSKEYELLGLGKTASGEQLMHFGLNLFGIFNNWGDYKSMMIRLHATDTLN
ncbi:MAG: alpha-galactosidase [Lachnospiraceae bacterium]|nr:alpha-galactosidase [Lachnospiraceae bacterium]